MDGGPKLPQMNDVHQLFNPTVAPPLVATKNVVSQSNTVPSPARNASVSKILKGIQRKNSKQDFISLPTNFRHVVHIGSDTVEVYDESGFPLGVSDRRKQVLEIDLERKNGGFGMNIKTLDNGKTIVSLIQPSGAAEAAGIQVDDEISHVDSVPIEGLKHEDVIAKIRGKNTTLLKLVRYVPITTQPKSNSLGSTTSGGSNHSSSSSSNAEERGKEGAQGCRVCGAAATFNCSACGPLITYCSVECQKTDWPTHKIDCQATKQKQRQDDVSPENLPATGACRVCRAKNARYRCACGGAMYCSQQCQVADWPNHKNNCTSMDQEAVAAGKPPADPNKFIFFAVAEKWLSKMVFLNGIFDCKWTVPLTCPDEKIPLFPTILVSGNALFVSYADRVTSVDIESGSNNWTTSLGYPFDGSPMCLCDYEDVIIVGAQGHVLALERRAGEEVWRKLLSREFSPVTLLMRSNILFATCDEQSFCVVVEDDDAHMAWRTSVSSQSLPKAMALIEGLENSSNLVVVSEKIVSCKAFDGQVAKSKSQEPSLVGVSISLKNDIFLTLRNGVLSRYNLKDFSLAWEIKIPECEDREGTLLQNSIVFIGGEPADQPNPVTDVVYVGIFCRVVAIDAKAGEIKWVAKLTKPEGDSSGMVSMVLLGDDLIAATAGRVFALSANSGNPLRKAQLPQKDNPHRFVSVVSQDYTERTISCMANVSSIFSRI